MRCGSCDQENSASARYCINCGVPLVTTAWAQSHAAPAPFAPTYAPFAPTYAPPVQQEWTAAPAGAGQAEPATAYPAYGYAPVQQIVNNISVSAAPAAAMPLGPSVAVFGPARSEVPFLLRVLYFLFVGLWLGALWTVIAWLLIASVLAMPLGLFMINRLPQVMTLKMPATETRVTLSNGVMSIYQGRVQQAPFGLRAAYFLLVGWWASLLWLLIAYALIVATLGLGLPIAFWMVDRVPAVTTLAR